MTPPDDQPPPTPLSTPSQNWGPPPANPFHDPKKVWFHQEDRGVPFLQTGQMPLSREGDPDHLKPQDFQKGFVRVFDLSDPAQLDQYNQVVNSVAKGTAILAREEIYRHRGKITVYARWMERYYATPDQVYAGAQRDAATGQISFRD